MNYRKISKELFLSWMLIFIPICLYFGLFTKNSVLTFVTALLAIVPLSQIIGFASKEISLQTNPSISGLVSATLGNLIELIIAVNALAHGLMRVVQASIIGSIIGNILLLVGLSLFFGGLRYKHQHFNKEAIGVSSTMLIIVVVGLTIPSVYSLVNPNSGHIMILSDLVAFIMALIYIAGLVFSLLTHKHMFDASDEIRAAKELPTLSLRISALVLFVSILVVAVVSEFLVREIQGTAGSIGITETFIGVILLAIITNIAEKSAAVNFARKNRLDISLEIGLSSANQIALFVVPILIIISQIMGWGFVLVFSTFEVVAVMLSVMIINDLAADGRCNWIEGAQLISVYLIIAIAFFFI